MMLSIGSGLVPMKSITLSSNTIFDPNFDSICHRKKRSLDRLQMSHKLLVNPSMANSDKEAFIGICRRFSLVEDTGFEPVTFAV